MRDTLGLTLEEFAVLHEEWDRWQTARYRTAWEQTRFIGQCSLAPYMKGGTRSRNLIEFDWEKKRPPLKRQSRTAARLQEMISKG